MERKAFLGFTRNCWWCQYCRGSLCAEADDDEGETTVEGDVERPAGRTAEPDGVGVNGVGAAEDTADDEVGVRGRGSPADVEAGEGPGRCQGGGGTEKGEKPCPEGTADWSIELVAVVEDREPRSGPGEKSWEAPGAVVWTGAIGVWTGVDDRASSETLRSEGDGSGGEAATGSCTGGTSLLTLSGEESSAAKRSSGRSA